MVKRRNFARLLQCVCITVLLVSASPAVAGSVHLGLGFSSASVKDDVNGVDDSSGGYALALGWEFVDTWSLEFFTSLGHSVTTGVPQNIYYPADTADYSLVFIGVGKSLWSLNDHAWTPWIEAGFAYAGLDWKTFYYQVSGGDWHWPAALTCAWVLRPLSCVRSTRPTTFQLPTPMGTAQVHYPGKCSPCCSCTGGVEFLQ